MNYITGKLNATLTDSIGQLNATLTDSTRKLNAIFKAQENRM
jgi:hypothetical protein